MTNEQYRHSAPTQKVIGVFFDVYNELGNGFLESVYENSPALALKSEGVSVSQQVDIPVHFRGVLVSSFCADLLIEGAVIVELKACRALNDAHIAQLLNYLKATNVEVGLLMNFGPKAEFKRLVFGNERKKFAASVGV